VNQIDINDLAKYTLLRHPLKDSEWRIDSNVRADIWEYIWKSNGKEVSDAFPYLNMMDVIRIMNDRGHELEDICKYPNLVFGSVGGNRIRFQMKSLPNDDIECTSLDFPCCWETHHHPMSFQLSCSPDARTLVDCAEFFSSNEEQLFRQVQAMRKALEIRLMTLSFLAGKFLLRHPDYQIRSIGFQPIIFKTKDKYRYAFEIDEDTLDDVCKSLDNESHFSISRIRTFLFSKLIDKTHYDIDFSFRTSAD